MDTCDICQKKFIAKSQNHYSKVVCWETPEGTFADLEEYIICNDCKKGVDERETTTIRDRKYEKMEMNEEEFAKYFDENKEEILSREIDLKFVREDKADIPLEDLTITDITDLRGVRRKDNGNYKILTPVGFDSTPFPRFAREVDSIAYFLKRID